MTAPRMLAWHDTLPSTIDEAHHRAAAGAPHGFGVAARRQTAGRGTRGRPWDSSAGGLWLSVVARPAGSGPVETLSLRIGLAVAERIERLFEPGANAIAIKWPNDLMADGKKLAGILCDARWHGDRLAWIVASVGLNIRNPIPLALRDRAIRLADLGVGLGPEDLAEPIRDAVAGAAACADALAADHLAALRDRDWLRGRVLLEPEPGIADGISETGRLRIRRSDGRVTAVLGSVRLAEQG
jgi:BirA family biotin operon repressor/biotin-[acetyl-CoA-carboxylase] ligase